MLQKCDVCEVEWDSQTQNHRRGTDCVAIIGVRVQGFERLVKSLQEKAAEFIKDHEAVELGGFKHLGEEIGRLRAQILEVEKKLKTLVSEKKS